MSLERLALSAVRVSLARVKDLLRDLMDRARASADYADARYVRTRDETLATRNGELDELDSSENEGIGVRVRLDGAWGFAATRGLDRRAADGALDTGARDRARPAPARTAGWPLASEPPAKEHGAPPWSATPSKFRWRTS